MTITTGGGVVTAIALTSANDAPDRDPTGFVLSGSNDGGTTFTEIASGDVPVFSDRFERQTVSIDNSTAYTTYALIFPTTAGPSGCCMQIAEVELLDYRPSAIAATDLSLKALLETQGFAAELVGPNYDPIDVDSRHYSFVVISSSLQDDSWAAKYAATTAPIINLDSSVQDALGFISSERGVYLSGTVSSAAQLQIVDASHPLSGGFVCRSTDDSERCR